MKKPVKRLDPSHVPLVSPASPTLSSILRSASTSDAILKVLPTRWTLDAEETIKYLNSPSGRANFALMRHRMFLPIFLALVTDEIPSATTLSPVDRFLVLFPIWPGEASQLTANSRAWSVVLRYYTLERNTSFADILLVSFSVNIDPPGTKVGRYDRAYVEIFMATDANYLSHMISSNPRRREVLAKMSSLPEVWQRYQAGVNLLKSEARDSKKVNGEVLVNTKIVPASPEELWVESVFSDE